MSEKTQNLYTPQEDLETAPPAYEPPAEDFSDNPSSSRSENATAPDSITDSKAPPSIPNPNSNSNSNSNTKKPIAIPAIDPYSSHSPFLRAFPPILRQSHNLPRESFLPLLDNLNKVIAESPPLEVLDVTGGILRSVPILFPLHWIGAAVSGLAQKGSSGVSKSRTDSLIKQANKEIFGPRNLRIEIARLDALAYIAQVPILSPSSGRIDNAAPVMQHLVAVDAVNTTSVSNYQAAINGGGGVSIPEEIMLDAVHQQIGILQPWIAELEFDPLPRTAQSKLTRFNTALKRYNEPRDERRERGKYREEREEEGMRKGLWLVIREFE
ncbi:uncharacterized protein TRUGW13939_11021 [Talaromyces rugulosus]|uniref:Uncharacterized protein n=1 Tax=Talaromyces rugulosus TaxID=121627 RepID=A0A7H8RBM8_TALRU|nr:uncharacterized protein TRUGW13939_11021 [Talaromyces rugulosus]QKX63850.1 hypothetical protein TRUGW13939_11021 [Talaromyces rugulosus]